MGWLTCFIYFKFCSFLEKSLLETIIFFKLEVECSGNIDFFRKLFNEIE